jgi:hypothetical protein
VNESAVKEVVTKGLYGLIALTVSGVLAFSVYVVRDLKEDTQHCEGQIAALQEQVKKVNETVIMNTGSIGRLEQDVIKVRGVKWISPRGEWDER